MKTLVSKFVVPQVEVRFSNLFVDAFNKRFKLTLGIKSPGKRKFTEREVEGTITSYLAEWFSLLRDEKVKVAADNEQGFEFIPTGNKLTNFQKYLKKRGIEEAPNILANMVFQCDNTSEDYAINPFKLVCYKDGRATLTMVNAAPKRMVQHMDPNSGEVTKHFYHKTFVDANGNTRRSFTTPKYYKRLQVEELQEVEVVS